MLNSHVRFDAGSLTKSSPTDGTGIRPHLQMNSLVMPP